MAFSDSKLLVLLAASSLIAMTGAILAPILPDIVHYLHVEPGKAGSLISLHFITMAIVTPILGILADRIGPLRLLLPSLVGYSVVGMAGALMPSLPLLMVTRGLLGVANGGIAAAGLGLMGKLYHNETRAQAIAYVATTLTLANIIYPLLAGWLGLTDWHIVFGLYGLGIPLALWAAFVFGRSEAVDTTLLSQQTTDADRENTPLQLLRQPQILKLLLCLFFISSSIYAVIVYLPLYMKATLASSPVLIGIVLATKAGGAALVSAFLVRRLAKQLGDMWTIALGAGTMAVSLAAIPHIHSLQFLVAIALLFGFGFGVVVPTLYGILADLAPDNLQSTILATATGANFLGQFLSPILLGPVLTNAGLSTVFYTSACVALSAGLLLFLPPSPYRLEPQSFVS